MSAEAWERAADAEALLQVSLTRTNQRKQGLFLCACVRSVLPLITGIDAAVILDAAEKLADEKLTDTGEWNRAVAQVSDYSIRVTDADVWLAGLLEAALAEDSYDATFDAVNCLTRLQVEAVGHVDTTPLVLVREVFGNPFHPVDFTPWRTDTAVALARAMYESRDFGAMPILADALQDAGCDNNDVLAHCRDANATHVRGCWVVDGVLRLP